MQLHIYGYLKIFIKCLLESFQNCIQICVREYNWWFKNIWTGDHMGVVAKQHFIKGMDKYWHQHKVEVYFN